MRFCALLYALLTMYALSAHAQTDSPLSPRYTKGIGVKHHSFGLVEIMANGSFPCTDIDRRVHTYTLDAKKADPRIVFLPVNEFMKDSPAQKAGLACGDSIFAVNGRDVTSVEELRRAINTGSESQVTLNVMRPDEIETTDRGRIHIKTWREVEVRTDTMQIDWVAEMSKQGPQAERSVVYNDGVGPFMSFGTESYFHEATPGNIVYRCALRYLGESSEIHIESLYFHLLGEDDERLQIPNRTMKVFEYTAKVEDEGLPTRVDIPIYVARQIHMKKNTEAVEKYGRTQVIGTGKRNDWYSWQRETIHCFFPEALSRKIEAKKKRFGQVSGR